MKNVTLLILLLSLIYSCGDNKNNLSISDQLSILEQSQILRKDPVAVEFFEALTASAKMITETSVDLNEYKKLIEPFQKDICDLPKEVFMGNLNMENYAAISCRLRLTKKAFYEKHTYLKKMNKEDRKELFMLLAEQPDYDMEKIRENAEKRQSTN